MSTPSKALVEMVMAVIRRLLEKKDDQPSIAERAAVKVIRSSVGHSGEWSYTFREGWYVVLAGFSEPSGGSPIGRAFPSLVSQLAIEPDEDTVWEISYSRSGSSPDVMGGTTRTSTFLRRRSIGDDGENPLTKEELEQMLRTAQGLIKNPPPAELAPMLQPEPPEYELPRYGQVKTSDGTVCCGMLMPNSYRFCPQCGFPNPSCSPGREDEPGGPVLRTCEVYVPEAGRRIRVGAYPSSRIVVRYCVFCGREAPKQMPTE